MTHIDTSTPRQTDNHTDRRYLTHSGVKLITLPHYREREIATGVPLNELQQNKTSTKSLYFSKSIIFFGLTNVFGFFFFKNKHFELLLAYNLQCTVTQLHYI